jgi:hypothetical protein
MNASTDHSLQTHGRMEFKDEMEALRRIASTEEFGVRMPPGMWESERFFSIELEEEAIYAEADFYSQRYAAADPSFDVDAWEREKLRLRVTPKNRKGFCLTHSLVRGLLSGRSAVFADGVILDRFSYLENVKVSVTDMSILIIQLNAGE